MKPIDFPQRNNILAKPEAMTDDQCTGLPCHHWLMPMDDDKGDTENTTEISTYPAIFSCWEFSDEELEEVIRTKKVWVNKMGRTLAPFSLFTTNPFDVDTNAGNQ